MNRYFKIIAVFDVDLFIPLFTHIFGEARQNGQFGLTTVLQHARSEQYFNCKLHD